jgi:hypothetical protein
MKEIIEKCDNLITIIVKRIYCKCDFRVEFNKITFVIKFSDINFFISIKFTFNDFINNTLEELYTIIFNSIVDEFRNYIQR